MRIAVFVGAVALVVSFAPWIQTSSAVLLVYEGFDYAPGDLTGQNGGLGFSGPWGTGGTIVAGSLEYTDINTDMLPTSGNRALISGSATTVSNYRPFNRTYGTDATYGPGTYWMSFVGERLEPHATLDENSIRSFGIQLHRGTGDERLSVGRVTRNPPAPYTWGFFSDGTATRYVDTDDSMFDLSFVVVQINIVDSTDANNSDNASVWINPTLDGNLGTPDAQLTVAAGNNFDYIVQNLRLFAGNTSGGNPYAEFTVDEIRLGTTLDDVLGGTALVPGDTDGDGMVEPEDLNPIRTNYLETVNLRTEGDLTGDLFVDFKDFRQWKTAILGGGGSLAGIDLRFLSVPEPASLAMLGSALFGFAIGARRRRQLV